MTVSLIPSVKAQTPYYRIDLSLNPEVYVLRGDNLEITVNGNFTDSCNVEFWHNQQKLTEYSHVVNTTRQFTVNQNYPYGEYEIKAIVGEQTVTTFLTVLDISDWQPATFPYQRSFKNIDYTFFSNGTLRAQQNSEILDIDLSTLRYLINLYDLDVTATFNDMNFRINVQKEGIANINFVFSFVHTGCKFIVSGELDQAREFSFNIKNPSKLKNLVDSVKQGNIIFDYSDLRKASHSFSYSDGVLTLSLPKTFSFDPVIFSDGFEGDPFNEWTNSGGSPYVVTSPVHHGVNACRIDGDNAGSNDYLEKSVSFSGSNPRFLRFYAYFDELGDTDYSGWLPAICYYGSYLGSVGVYHSDGSDYLRVVYNDQWGNFGTTVLQEDTWYSIEIEQFGGTGDAYVKVYLNGVLECNNTGLTQTSVPDRVRISNFYDYKGLEVIFDCVVADDEYIGVEVSGQNVTETFYENVTVTSSITDQKEMLKNYGDGISFQSEITTQTETQIIMIETISETLTVSGVLYIVTDISVTDAETALALAAIALLIAFASCALVLIYSSKK